MKGNISIVEKIAVITFVWLWFETKEGVECSKITR